MAFTKAAAAAKQLTANVSVAFVLLPGLQGGNQDFCACWSLHAISLQQSIASHVGEEESAKVTDTGVCAAAREETGHAVPPPPPPGAPSSSAKPPRPLLAAARLLISCWEQVCPVSSASKCLAGFMSDKFSAAACYVSKGRAVPGQVLPRH